MKWCEPLGRRIDGTCQVPDGFLEFTQDDFGRFGIGYIVFNAFLQCVFDFNEQAALLNKRR